MQQKSAAPFQEQRFYLLHRSIRYQNRQLPAYQSAAVLPVSETLGGRGQHHVVERRRGGQRELQTHTRPLPYGQRPAHGTCVSGNQRQAQPARVELHCPSVSRAAASGGRPGLLSL